MKAARVLAAVAVALVVQTTLGSLVPRGSAAVDLALIVVVYVALTSGPVTGLLAGTVAGLAQDALGSGVLGIGGLSKTLVGYAVGILATQFIMTAPLPRFVVFVAATFLHAAVFIGLYVVLDLRVFPSPVGAVLAQALGNGFVGVVGSIVVELVRDAWRRRRRRG